MVEYTEPTCSNCAYAEKSLLDWYFCKHPFRSGEHQNGYLQGVYPSGGIPQSRDHTCALHPVKNVNDPHFQETYKRLTGG